MFILAWPGSPFFRIMNGEPAMSIVPNLLVSGILSILIALILLGWVLLFVQRKGSGLILIGLSLLLLLVGGGFGPPLMGIILGAGALGLHRAPGTSAAGVVRFAGRLWPWIYGLCLAAWLLLFPGLNLIDLLVGIEDPTLVMTVLPLSAFGLLVLALACAAAWDKTRA